MARLSMTSGPRRSETVSGWELGAAEGDRLRAALLNGRIRPRRLSALWIRALTGSRFRVRRKMGFLRPPWGDGSDSFLIMASPTLLWPRGCLVRLVVIAAWR